MSNVKQPRFHKLLEDRIIHVVKRDFLNEQLTPDTLRAIRETIRDQLNNIFMKSNFKPSQKAVTWLCDQYFKNIRINDDQLISDTVVINEYTLPELELSDVALFRDLFLETKLGPDLDAELQKRKNDMS